MSIHRYNNFSMFSLLYLCLGLMCFCHTCRQTTTPSLSLTLSRIVGCWDVYENYFTLYVQGVGNLLYLSCSLRYYISLGIGMCGGATFLYFSTWPMDIKGTFAENFVCLLILVYVLLCFSDWSRFSKKRQVKYRKIGSYNRSRRRVLWVQKKVSRT